MIMRIIFAGGLLLTGMAAGARAQQPDELPVSYPASNRDASIREVVQPCIGAGYVPYDYPGTSSCRCGNDCCFAPHRYYCGNDQYKKGWLRKWAGTQLGKRSMLDDYPCACIAPTAVPRLYYRTARPTIAIPPPAPAEELTPSESN